MPVLPAISPRPTSAPKQATPAAAPAGPASTGRPTAGIPTNTVSRFEGNAVAQPQRNPVNAWDSYPHPADIDGIVAIKDDATRNYAITRGYYDLSTAMSGLLGSDDANWTTFAVWASNSAGESIRHELIPEKVVDFLDRDESASNAKTGFERLLSRLGFSAPRMLQNVIEAGNDAMDGVRQGVAGGNRAVFNEIGREYAVFIETFDGDTSLDPVKLQKYLSHFSPAQSELRQAFHAYAQAMFETDPAKKSEQIFLGNMLIGHHEQRQLTPFIAQAMNAPVESGFKALLEKELDDRLDQLPLGGGRFVRRMLEKLDLLDKTLDPLAKALARGFREVATRQVMTLTTSNETLALGEDLPPPHGGIPKALRTVENPDAQAVLAALDLTPNSLENTGGRDWVKLDQRMHFIIDLFRSRQQDPALFDEPFARTERYGRPAVA